MNDGSLDNPYRSPATTLGHGSDAECSKFEELGRLFVCWEKLRIYYNLIGALPALLIVAVRRDAEAAVTVILGGLGANLCFCLGPLVNGYLLWIGVRDRAVTYILFAAGSGLMLLLAGGVASVVLGR